MDFANSTHRAHWLFNANELHAQRTAALSTAAQSMKRARGDAQDEDGHEAKRAKEMPVTVEEEAVLRTYFEQKIKAICSTLQYPLKVQATASAYFKRFYTARSCLEYDPSRLMPTCIYLACKVEEAYVSAEDFCKALSIDLGHVLKLEVPLLQALNFDLVVFSPYRALAGLFLELHDLREHSPQLLDEPLASASPDTLKKAEQRAQRSAEAIMSSDAPLLYTPGQLAAAAARSAFKASELGCGRFMEHVARRGLGSRPGSSGAGPQSESEAIEALSEAMQGVDALVTRAMSEEQGLEKRAVDVDRRIKLWRKSCAGGGGQGAGGAVLPA